MFLSVSICLVTLCLAFGWYYWKFYAPYSGFPSGSGLCIILKNFLMGNIPKNTRATHVYFQMLIDILMDFRSEGLYIFWLQRPNLFIFGEEAVKTFSTDLFCINKAPEYEILREYFGNSLLSCDREEWIERRKMLNPVFHVGMLKSKANILNKHAATLVKTLLTEKDKSSVIIIKYLQTCSFNNISEFVLGIKADDPEKRRKMERLIEIVDLSQEFSVYRIIHPWLQSRRTLRFFSRGRKYLRDLEELFQIVNEILLEIKEVVLSRSTGEEFTDMCSTRRKSFGEIIMEHHLKDPSYTVQDMLFELNTFISAGYDTVSYAMMWCLFTMGHHPEVQEMVYREVEALGKNEISYDDLKDLKYLECVILETLRLYPVAPVFSRQIERNVQCGKYNVPKGTTVAFFSYVYHRNPELYPDPEKFNPERFLENSQEKRPWTHIAFGAGIRTCIGTKFAMVEMKIVLAHIIRSFEVVSLDRKEDLKLCWEVILNTVTPLRMRLTPRQGSL